MDRILKKLKLLSVILTIAGNAGQATGEIPDVFANAKISDGQPVYIENRGFTITPPQGWRYQENHLGSTITMQPQELDANEFRRTIQATSFPKAFYFTPGEITAFEEQLVKHYTQGDAKITNYRILSQTFIDIETINKAYLIYTAFEAEGHSLMQMHILVSAQDRHFLVSYTDRAQHFETESETTTSTNLTEAWTVMNSVRLDSQPSSVTGTVMHFLGVFGVLLLAWFVASTIRSRKKSNGFDDFARNGDRSPHAPKEDAYTISPVSTTPVSTVSVPLTESDLARSQHDGYVEGETIEGLTNFGENFDKKVG